jgi:hypothetical protein
MTVIEFPDDQAAALKVQAQANGLTVQQWLLQLAEQSRSSLFAGEDQDDAPQFLRGKKQAAAAILDLQKNVKPDPDGWTIRDYIDYGRR